MLRGEELMSARVQANYADLFRIGSQIQDFAMSEAIQYPNLSGDEKYVVGACIPLLATGVKVCRGIHILAGRANDELGMMALRPLAETWASLGWILAEPSQRVERALEYLWGEIIENYRLTQHFISKGITEGIPAEHRRYPEGILNPIREYLLTHALTSEGGHRQAKKRAEKRYQKIIRRPHWASATNEEMFVAADAFMGGDEAGRWTHTFGFKHLSGILHGRYPREFATSSPDGAIISPNFDADDKYVRWVLFFSNLLLIGILDALNRGLVLGINERIEGFYRDLKSSAGG
jgi:hypothetical protein